MRRHTAEQSPGLKWFGDHLEADGLYPAADVEIYWDEPCDGTKPRGVRDVVVAYYPRRLVGANDHPIWREWQAYDTWNCCRGGSCADWPTGHLATPEAVYGFMIAFGFTDRHEHFRALREFARIRECEWARRMLAAIESEFGEDWDARLGADDDTNTEGETP